MKIQKLLLGTGNPRKQATLRHYLSDLPIECVSISDLGLSEPEETADSLEGNAILKAKYYSEATGLPTLSDDGGFEIPALGNFPGTHTHRFAGHTMTDDEVIAGILEKMKGLGGTERQARFRVVVALAIPSGGVHTAQGAIDGIVPESPYEKRVAHFPYRSLLYVTTLHKWFYDVTEGEEERLGYRKAAVEQLKKYLK